MEGLFYSLSQGGWYTRDTGECGRRSGPTPSSRLPDLRGARSETLTRTERAKEVERSNAERFCERRMLDSPRQLRRLIELRRSPPERPKAALALRGLGRLRGRLWLLILCALRRPPLGSPLGCSQSHLRAYVQKVRCGFTGYPRDPRSGRYRARAARAACARYSL